MQTISGNPKFDKWQENNTFDLAIVTMLISRERADLIDVDLIGVRPVEIGGWITLQDIPPDLVPVFEAWRIPWGEQSQYPEDKDLTLSSGYPEQIDWTRDTLGDYRQIVSEEINAMATAYLQASTIFTFHNLTDRLRKRQRPSLFQL